jgi:hypothetical protein
VDLATQVGCNFRYFFSASLPLAFLNGDVGWPAALDMVGNFFLGL